MNMQRDGLIILAHISRDQTLAQSSQCWDPQGEPRSAPTSSYQPCTCLTWGLAGAAPRRGCRLPAALGSPVISAQLWNIRVPVPQETGRRNFQIFLYLFSSGKRNVQYSSPTSDTSCWGLAALPARSMAPKPSPLAAAVRGAQCSCQSLTLPCSTSLPTPHSHSCLPVLT